LLPSADCTAVWLQKPCSAVSVTVQLCKTNIYIANNKLRTNSTVSKQQNHSGYPLLWNCAKWTVTATTIFIPAHSMLVHVWRHRYNSTH
jgi:hypothetical protein